MPITKSAKKSLAVSRRKQAVNRIQEIDLSKALKKVDAKNINEVISKIDKAAKRNIISKNKAGRMKSRLSKKYGTPKVAKTAVKPVVKSKKIAVTKSKTVSKKK